MTPYTDARHFALPQPVSLFNPTIRRPPPVRRMRSLTSFTPYYSEDVTYTMSALRKVEDEVDLLNLLTSLFPDEWANLLERTRLDTSRL